MTAKAPRLVCAEPQLFSADVAASCAFYASRLGFSVRFLHGQPPFYGQVERGGARLNIRHIDAGRPVPSDPREPDLLAASIVVEGIEALFEEFSSKGVAFHSPLRTEMWGARTFIVADPDGNLVLFAGER
ncbi:VOC family protein [Mesorhizobium sp. LHD-90]|uniref:bleomycin resistance protein n=1 Tax=Mesorhizobium sp. LHD-90 TaxID=3071414 RepID=UPI0027E0943A|nr:VOC family protein [Mesorhizobium sp. LHD-90]MDQ6433030.1 VOC family protein [Mesorhizobium sp. LHD-90]